ncbi:hypothetical protein EC991_007478 [Linnemannia zychae]|nr:hypothetical protein EC991_007478 [Linnemannia zychae]
MEETQSFRLNGKTDTVEIPVNFIGGQNTVYWSDIQQVFPRVKHIQNGNIVVTYLRNSDGNSIIPHRIKHCPGVVPDVYLSTTLSYVLKDPEDITTDLAFTNVQAEVPIVASINSPRSDININELSVKPQASSIAIHAESVSSHVTVKVPFTGLSPTESCQIFEAVANAMHTQGQLGSVIHKLDALHTQGVTTQMIVQEVLELQKQMNDRLTLIQSKTEAILAQNFELHEYPIPRLFIVLPETPISWDPLTMFCTKFRLHFICECGDHTKPAKGDGYYQQVLPACSRCRFHHSKGLDYTLKYPEVTRALIAKSNGVYVGDEVSTKWENLADYLAGVERLEGADLRQLGSYLAANSSDNLLGNLYCMMTKDGHVKWVCLDHYRTGYQENHAQRLRDKVRLAQGVFDGQLGRVQIVLTSKFAATEFYAAVHSAKGIFELDVSLNWDCVRSDLEQFVIALRKSTLCSGSST